MTMTSNADSDIKESKSLLSEANEI